MDFNPLIERKREPLRATRARDCRSQTVRKSQARERAHARAFGIKQLLERWNELRSARKQLDDNRELATSRDVEIAAMADDEIPDLEKRVVDLERDIQIGLLPPDENEDRDAIVEIRAGTGGSEAAIFAADLYRMYIGMPRPPA